MRAMLFALLSGAALSLCGSAVAGTTDTSSSQAATSSVPRFQHIDPNAVQNVALTTANGQKLICHQQAHEGSVLPQRICLTQRSWDRMRQQEQAMVSNWEMHSSGARR
ncbi:MAG TPA: hypothetical protein VMF58_16670 [Rhizomicrobium sp.]|nr:hypothetical protein [Rhizomicrobium sp.]